MVSLPLAVLALGHERHQHPTYKHGGGVCHLQRAARSMTGCNPGLLYIEVREHIHTCKAVIVAGMNIDEAAQLPGMWLERACCVVDWQAKSLPHSRQQSVCTPSCHASGCLGAPSLEHPQMGMGLQAEVMASCLC